MVLRLKAVDNIHSGTNLEEKRKVTHNGHRYSK
jgi:hypothetical protein